MANKSLVEQLRYWEGGYHYPYGLLREAAAEIEQQQHTIKHLSRATVSLLQRAEQAEVRIKQVEAKRDEEWGGEFLERRRAERAEERIKQLETRLWDEI